MKKALILYWHGLGDVVQLMCHLRCLFNQGYRTDIMCIKSVIDSHLLDHCPYIGSTIEVPNPWDDGNFNQLSAMNTHVFRNMSKDYDWHGMAPHKSAPGTHKVDINSNELNLSFVSIGNPHAVYFISLPVADFPLSEIGPKVEQHPIFPNRANFEVASVIDRQQIEARVWERGVGETLACGTGACAITVIAQKHGFVGEIVDIMLPGGTLNVEWDGLGEVFLSGPAEIVFNGEWPAEVKMK